MNVRQLIEELEEIVKRHNLDPEDIEVNYRVDFESDIEEVNWVCEDLYDAETNSILKSITLYCDDTGLA